MDGGASKAHTSSHKLQCIMRPISDSRPPKWHAKYSISIQCSTLIIKSNYSIQFDVLNICCYALCSVSFGFFLNSVVVHAGESSSKRSETWTYIRINCGAHWIGIWHRNNIKTKEKKNRNMQWKTFTQKRNRIHNSFGCVGRAHVITQFYMRIRCAVMRLTISTTASSSWFGDKLCYWSYIICAWCGDWTIWHWQDDTHTHNTQHTTRIRQQTVDAGALVRST